MFISTFKFKTYSSYYEYFCLEQHEISMFKLVTLIFIIVSAMSITANVRKFQSPKQYFKIKHKGTTLASQ